MRIGGAAAFLVAEWWLSQPMQAKHALAVAVLLFAGTFAALPIAQAATVGDCSDATTANPRPDGWFLLGKPAQAHADDCFHQETTVNNPDTATIDVVIVPPAGPLGPRDISLLRQSVQMWEDGIKGMAQATDRAWLADGLQIRPFAAGLDAALPGYLEAVTDPEIIIVTGDVPAVVAWGVAGQGADAPIDFCHGLPQPAPTATQVALLPSFDDHHGLGWGTASAQCGNWGGRVCIVSQTGLFDFPNDARARELFDLNSHEFGHCLGLGHVGDASDFGAMAYPPDDIMSYSQDGWAPSYALCVSNLDVKTMAFRYRPLVPGSPATPEPGVIGNRMTMEGGKLTWPGNVVGPEYLGTSWRVLREDGSLGTSASQCPQPVIDLLADPLAIPTPKEYGPVEPADEPLLTIESPSNGATGVGSPVTVSGSVDREGGGLAAHAGGPYEGAPGAAIAISGSATGATGAATCAWTTTGGGSFADAAACATTVTYAAEAGSPFTLTFTVTDTTGSATDTATVTVSSSPSGTRIGSDAAGDQESSCGPAAPLGCDLAFAAAAMPGLDLRAAYIQDRGDDIRFTVQVEDASKFFVDPTGHPAVNTTNHMNAFVLSVSFEALSPTFGFVSGTANIERVTGQSTVTGTLSQVIGVLSTTTPDVGPVTVDLAGDRFSVDIPKSAITFFSQVGSLSALNAAATITVENGNVDSLISVDLNLDTIESSTWSPSGSSNPALPPLPGASATASATPVSPADAAPDQRRGLLWRFLAAIGLASDGDLVGTSSGPVASNGCSGELPQPDVLTQSPTCTLAVPASADHVRLTYTATYSGLIPAVVELMDSHNVRRAYSLDDCETPATLAVNGEVDCTMDVTTGVDPGTWTAYIHWQLGETTQTYDLTLEAFESGSGSTSSSSSTTTPPPSMERVEIYEGATFLGSDTVSTSGTPTDSWSVSGLVLSGGPHTLTAKWFESGVPSSGTPLDSATVTFEVAESANTAPVASFTASTDALTVDVDGSGSTDTDEDTLTYAWTFGDGGTATGATASHTYAADGTYTVTLTVDDGNGGSDADEQDVTVSDGGTDPDPDPTTITIENPTDGASVGLPFELAGSLGTDGGAGDSSSRLGDVPAAALALTGIDWQPWMSEADARLADLPGFVGIVPPETGGQTAQAVFTGPVPTLSALGIDVPAGWTLQMVGGVEATRMVREFDPPIALGTDGLRADLTAQPIPWNEGIGPGTPLAQDFDGDGFGEFGCTANFVWKDQDGALYLGAAGHCFLPAGASATESAGGDFDPSGVRVFACRSTCVLGGLSGGSEQGVLIQDWVELGAVVYARQTDGVLDVGNDFGLVRIPDALLADVSPHMPVWGGPDAVDGAVNKADVVLIHGNAAWDAETFATKSRAGLGLGEVGAQLAGNDRHNAWGALLKSSGGDSGSAINTVKTTTVDPTALPQYDPRAGGILTHSFQVPCVGLCTGYGLGIVEGTTVPRAIVMAREAGLCIEPLMAGDDPLSGDEADGTACGGVEEPAYTVEARASPVGGPAGAWSEVEDLDVDAGTWSTTMAGLSPGAYLVEARLMDGASEVDVDSIEVTLLDGIGTLGFDTPLQVDISETADQTLRLAVPSGVSQMTVTVDGPACEGECTFDVDLYVREGQAPAVAPNPQYLPTGAVTDPNDCSSETTGNDELCDIGAPAATTWYVTLHAYVGSGTVTLLAQRDLPDQDGDGVPDVRDGDLDGDGLPNAVEVALGMDPQDPNVVPSVPETSVCVVGTGGSAAKDFDHDGTPALYAWSGTRVTLHADGSTTTAPASGWCWMAGDADDDGTERVPDAPDSPVAAPATSVCVPGTGGGAAKDYDGDGTPAYYAWAGTRVTLQEDGTVTTAPQPGWCWVAGDADDDGTERVPDAPDSPVAVPEGSTCVVATGGGAQKDYDGDGTPAFYAWSGTRVTTHADGSVTATPQPGWCWVMGDLDDDGQDRMPATPASGPSAPVSPFSLPRLGW